METELTSEHVNEGGGTNREMICSVIRAFLSE